MLGMKRLNGFAPEYAALRQGKPASWEDIANGACLYDR
jgi:hypothetical protein